MPPRHPPRAPRRRSAELRLAGTLVLAVAVAAVPAPARPAAADGATADGEPVDVAPFGQRRSWSADGRDVGVGWTDPRDIVRVEAEFAGAAPDPSSVHLDWWHSAWPAARIPRDHVSGSGIGGWTALGDPYRGEWKEADARVTVAGGRYVFTFEPVDAHEFPDLADELSPTTGGRFDARYRTTYKIRIRSNRPVEDVRELRAFTDSVWRRTSVDVLWGGGSESKERWDGRVEAFNGHIERVRPAGDDSRVRILGPAAWRSTVRGEPDGIRLDLRYAVPAAAISWDETVVTVRTRRESFSFSPAEVLRRGSVLIPDLGVLVRPAGASLTWAEAVSRWHARREAHPDLYTRVAMLDEQTFEGAWQAMPPKKPQYIPLGFEGGRQHFRLDEQGRVRMSRAWIDWIPGRDTPRCRWEGDALEVSLGLPGRRDGGGVLEGDLPVMVGRWERNGVAYRQTSFAIPLAGVPDVPRGLAADDPVVLMTRVEIRAATPRTAVLRLATRAGHGDETLDLDGDLGVVRGDDPADARVRFRIAPAGAGGFVAHPDGGTIAIDGIAAPGRTIVVDVAIPFVTLTAGDARDLERLRALEFDSALEAVRRYWRARIDRGTRIRTPEPVLDDFFRAVTHHLLLNTERSVREDGVAVPRVGTLEYGVYGNESSLMVTELDRRGFHELARQALELWLRHQGSVGLPGEFTSSEGVLYGADGYEAGGYNQHHGWILWALAEHARYTGDVAWLERVAPNIVRACDWIVRERRAHAEAVRGDAVRGIEAGLLPPGALEDVGDWRVWLATNVYTWRGLAAAADVLGGIGHPEAARFAREAEAYREAILGAFEEARVRAPVVRLRDGSSIPQVPVSLHRRGRSYGWIAQTLEGPVHLICSGALDPRDRTATWILRDYEDNLFLSSRFGYAMSERQVERDWFAHGGFSQQAMLLCTPSAYLARGQLSHFFRAYFNGFAANFFADTRMLTEHALTLGDFTGDHYKTSDESVAARELRRMFVQERGDELDVGAALPRAWLADGEQASVEGAVTYFGTTSVRYRSTAAVGRIEASIDPPRRRPPTRVRVFFRHPDGLPMTGCEVDGRAHRAFDAERGIVDIPAGYDPVTVVALYGPKTR